MNKKEKPKTKTEDFIEYDGMRFNLKKLKEYRVYQRQYTKENYKGYAIRFRLDDDSDIIDFLENGKMVHDKTKYFRDIIRADMKKKGLKTNKD